MSRHFPSAAAVPTGPAFSERPKAVRAGAFAREPQWVPRRQLVNTPLPAQTRSWLFEEHSLTRRVQAACKGCFRVRLLSQGDERPMFNERRLLNMPDPALGMVRQVQLLCEGRPWIYGRTVIPLKTLSGARRRLAHLGERSLGAALFSNITLRRFEVQIARILPRHDLYRAATANLLEKPAEIWGRRSVFHVDHKPLLVSEVFLPGLVGCGPAEDSAAAEHLLV